MARPTRIDFPGAWHHVMNRGARRAPIFRDSEDCQAFLDAVGESVERDGIEVHAYALMPNHYHLLVRSPHGTLSKAMQRLGARHTAWLNERHGWDGPVFRGRFRNRLVTRDEHLVWLVAYIHLNPLRAGLAHSLAAEAWTSHEAYLGIGGRPPWLSVDEMLGRFGGPEELDRFVSAAHVGRQCFPEDLEVARWAARDRAPEPGPSDGREAGSAGVEMVLRAVARVTGVDRDRLMAKERGRSANPARRFAAWALARSTPLANAEIGGLLDMSAGRINTLLSRMRRGAAEPVATWQKTWLENGEPRIAESDIG